MGVEVLVWYKVLSVDLTKKFRLVIFPCPIIFLFCTLVDLHTKRSFFFNSQNFLRKLKNCVLNPNVRI